MGREISDKITKKAFHEVMHNEPSTVKRAKVSKERKRKMRIAIALDKARKAGADIPEKD